MKKNTTTELIGIVAKNTGTTKKQTKKTMEGKN